MDTSGTGHYRCPSQRFPTHQAPGTPPLGGIGKIKKRGFGFKRGGQKILEALKPSHAGEEPPGIR